MNFLGLAHIVEKAAPLLASIIGGPEIGAAAQVISLIAKEFEGDETDLPQLINTIQNHPNASNKLQLLQSSPETGDILQMMKNAKSAELDIKLEN